MQTEDAKLRELIAAVPKEAHAAQEAAYRAMWERYEREARKAEVLFEIPTRECSGTCDPSFKGAYYGVPERWGFGPLAVDDDNALWFVDYVGDRILVFDHTGKVLKNLTVQLPEDLKAMFVTRREIWLVSSEWKWLRRLDHDGLELAVHGPMADRGEDDCVSWRYPGNPRRFFQPCVGKPGHMTDVSFAENRMVFSKAEPFRVDGQRYYIDCDRQETRPATLVIDDKAVPVSGCLDIRYIAPNGHIYSSQPFLHMDANGKLLGVAARPGPEYTKIFYTGPDWAIGTDNALYAYIVKKKSIQFVRVPFFPQ